MAGTKSISPNDRLSRFIRSKRHIAISKHIVKPGAFLPPPNKKLSVFHTEHINEIRIWKLADAYIGLEKRVEFRADIISKNIEDTNLSIELDNNPKFHGNIIGWPDGKDMQKACAMELASVAKLQIRQLKEVRT